MANLQESASLFEVNTPDYKQLRGCRREVRKTKIYSVVLQLQRCIMYLLE